jgi:hypothetical protein
VSLGEESMAEHMEFLLKVREENVQKLQKGAWWSPGGIWRQREHASLLQVLLKSMLTYGKRGTR